VEIEVKRPVHGCIHLREAVPGRRKCILKARKEEQLKEGKEQEVKLHDVDLEVFNLVVDWLSGCFLDQGV